MSDIAPFVAATLRDKVVAELMEENKKLREDLNKARTIEITWQNGEPVHTSALFSDGRYTGNPNLWQVDFPQEDETGGIALSALWDTEVRVGGIMRTRFRGNETLHGLLSSHELDGEDRKVINFCCNGNGGLWLEVLVQGWPEESWRQVAAEELAARGMLANEGFNLLQVLIDRIAREFQDATVRFLDVAFFVDTVRGAIGAFDATVEDHRPSRREERAFVVAVISRMRDAGEEGVGAPFTARAAELIQALDAMGVYETDEEFDNLLNELIRLQRSTGGGEAFLNIIPQAFQTLQGLQIEQQGNRDSDLDDNEANLNND